LGIKTKRPRHRAGAGTHRQSALRILIAHDQEIVRIGMEALVKPRRKWRICGEATTGREAVEKVARLKPNLLVLKLDLPDCSGLDVIPAVLKIRPDVKVLLLATEDSAIAARRAVLSPTTARHALNEGALGPVLKPDASDFVFALDALSRNRPFVSANIMRKLGFRSQTDLLLYAIRHKVIELPEPPNSVASVPA
jgi:DNA-binding NarL/FixJ family response regulator